MALTKEREGEPDFLEIRHFGGKGEVPIPSTNVNGWSVKKLTYNNMVDKSRLWRTILKRYQALAYSHYQKMDVRTNTFPFPSRTLVFIICLVISPFRARKHRLAFFASLDCLDKYQATKFRSPDWEISFVWSGSWATKFWTVQDFSSFLMGLGVTW